jgi:hypothetical protein
MANFDQATPFTMNAEGVCEITCNADYRSNYKSYFLPALSGNDQRCINLKCKTANTDDYLWTYMLGKLYELHKWRKWADATTDSEVLEFKGSSTYSAGRQNFTSVQIQYNTSKFNLAGPDGTISFNPAKNKFCKAEADGSYSEGWQKYDWKLGIIIIHYDKGGCIDCKLDTESNCSVDRSLAESQEMSLEKMLISSSRDSGYVLHTRKAGNVLMGFIGNLNFSNREYFLVGTWNLAQKEWLGVVYRNAEKNNGLFAIRPSREKQPRAMPHALHHNGIIFVAAPIFTANHKNQVEKSALYLEGPKMMSYITEFTLYPEAKEYADGTDWSDMFLIKLTMNTIGSARRPAKSLEPLADRANLLDESYTMFIATNNLVRMIKKWDNTRMDT